MGNFIFEFIWWVIIKILGILKILFKNFELSIEVCRRYRWILWLVFNFNVKIFNDSLYISIYVCINILNLENI